MSTSDAYPQEELTALIVPLGRALLAAETALLQDQGTDMWDYIVLRALGRGGAPSQLELAKTTGRDKTRLIRNLDALERAGFITRRPDQADRRAMRVEISPSGARATARCHAAIQALDAEVLAKVTPEDQLTFRRVLAALHPRSAPASHSQDS